MIFRNLLRRRTRTLLSVLGIAVGVAAIVSMTALSEGFASGFDKAFTSNRADLIVSEKEAIVAFLSSIDASTVDEIRGIRGVAEAHGTIVGMVQMQDMPYFVVKGEDPQSFTMRGYRLVAGESLVGRRQVLIGVNTARNLHKGVGDTLRLNDFSYRIVGVYETGTALEDGGAVISLEDAQRTFDKVNQVSYVNVRARIPAQINDIKSDVESQFEDLSAARSGEPTKQSEMLALYGSFGWFLGIFAAAVGGLGMMNTTLMSVLERTREIGVLRALGWRRARVLWLILGESLAIAAAGGIAGVALGAGLTALASLSPAVSSMMAGTLSWRLLLEALLLALVLGVVGGAYPAWRASRLQPVEAMRAEGGATGASAWTPTFVTAFGGSTVRNLFRRPGRTLVTTIGIGIGVGFLVAVVALVEGMRLAFVQMAGEGRADLMAEQRDASDLSVSRIQERTLERLRGHPEVKSASGVVIGIASQPDVPFIMVFGVNPNEDYVRHLRVREGRAIERPREVMLGRNAANSLRKAVGDRLSLAGSAYTVTGIYETGNLYEDIAVTMSVREAQDHFGDPQQLSLLFIQVHDPSRADTVARQLEAEYPDIIVARSAEATERMQDFASTYAMLDALIVLIVIVGGIVMTNAVLMSVFERTQEIGLLRAIGWRRIRVVRMVLAESLVLAAVAACMGIVIGIGLAYLTTLDATMGSLLTPAFSPLMLGQVAGLALILGGVGAVYPAWRASGLSPIEALRYE